MRAYYGSRISEHMTETPEGFLICHHVPIARTGFYEYMPHELGMDGDEPVRVFRSEDEVFSDKAIASFEGKPVALGHPPEDITPDNTDAYTCGHIQNVRRGKDEESDLLIADLFITSKELIEKVREGLREVSCGYECAYEDKGEGMQQFDIRGNHVAVVEYGRAGDRVAIRDSDTAREQPDTGHSTKQKERNKPMSKFSILSKFMKVVSHDADPAMVDEVVEVLADTIEETPPAPAPEEKPAFDAETAYMELKDEFAKLVERFDEMCAAKDECKDPMDELEAELAADEENVLEDENTVAEDEESITLEEETADEETVEEKVVASDERNEPLRAAIRELKPILAMLPAEEKKKATDAAVKALRGSLAKKSVHAKINEARTKKAADTASVFDPADIGREIMKKHNAHYQNM